MAVEVVGDFELEKIRAEIKQEKQMKEMLEQSSSELRYTIEELEKRYDGVVDEGNEWKTRCETQQEMNDQLDKQIFMLQSKVQEAKSNLKDAGKSTKDMKNFDDLSDATPHMVRMLEKEKNMLHNQMRDIEWRLDQESKAYHKAHEERKTYSTEIHAAATRNRLPITHRELEPIPGSRTPRDMGRNIPEDQRILDPKRGPIRKTAAVKSLPSLEMT
ncbi:hypothetical protein KP79_PYT12520 [Mizuhopecten yessoensis]|uniref:Coiled-coil domain-containing protein 169 n=1 Tax=Mizuhopecten yessoensis TaxID=6573 RepID=A0A210QE62_MIZYE|nr:hypothetical protein KP79_PYT12520 [Mizuhopecten yessoensis]